MNISYSCLPNIKSIVNAHTRKILHPSTSTGRSTCNCINMPQCLLDQKCLSDNNLYRANIAPLDENSETKVYCGICETTFKLRYTYRSTTETASGLSNKFWKIIDNNRSANTTCEILGRHQAYNTSSKRCSLCLNEKLKIALHRNNNMLNKQTEILKKCRHRNKYALISHDSKD